MDESEINLEPHVMRGKLQPLSHRFFENEKEHYFQGLPEQESSFIWDGLETAKAAKSCDRSKCPGAEKEKGRLNHWKPWEKR